MTVVLGICAYLLVGVITGGIVMTALVGKTPPKSLDEAFEKWDPNTSQDKLSILAAILWPIAIPVAVLLIGPVLLYWVLIRRRALVYHGLQKLNGGSK